MPRSFKNRHSKIDIVSIAIGQGDKKEHSKSIIVFVVLERSTMLSLFLFVVFVVFVVAVIIIIIIVTVVGLLSYFAMKEKRFPRGNYFICRPFYFFVIFNSGSFIIKLLSDPLLVLYFLFILKVFRKRC